MKQSTTKAHIIIKNGKKYWIDNQGSFPMSVFVPTLVKMYICDNALCYEELKNIFNDDLIQPKYKGPGVLCTIEEFNNWKATTKNNRFYIRNGALRSHDGVEFYVNTQWCKKDSEKILELAKTIGYDVVIKDDNEAHFDNYNSIEIPSNYDRSLGLHQNIIVAIQEYIDIIEKRLQDDTYTITEQQKKTYTSIVEILRMYYLEDKGYEEIASIKRCTPTHIRELKNKYISNILNDSPVFNDITINQNLLDLLQSLKSECIFSTLDHYNAFAGTCNNKMLAEINLDTFTIPNKINRDEVTIIIPKNTKKLYEHIWGLIEITLQENPLPTDRGIIEKLICDKIEKDEYIKSRLADKEDKADKEDLMLFVEKILECDDLIDIKENNCIQIKYKYLSSAARRIARIVYENTCKGENCRITTDEIEKRYYLTFPKSKGISISSARAFGICSEGKSRKWYYGEPKKPIQQKIKEYAEEKIVFYYNEIKEALKNDGYTLLQTLRVYITTVCAVDKNNSDHFCHKEFVDKYTEYEWRTQIKYGWSNWIYNAIKKILKNNEKISITKLIEELEEHAKETEYKNTLNRFRYNITTYCNEDSPFALSGDNVVINKGVYECTDFEIIGLRGYKYAYYKQIRAFVANEVKRSKEGKITFVEIIRLVNKNIDSTIGRNTIKRAIEDKEKRFEPIGVDIINENGTIYVKWIENKAKAEPIYTITSSDQTSNVLHIDETKSIERPEIRYRQNINFEELSKALKRELAYYGKWMQKENIDFLSAVDSFVQYMKTSNNYNINMQLSLNLYEYWFASTDIYDRYRYLRDILITYEGMLIEMYNIQNNVEYRKHSLMEIVQEFNGLPDIFLYTREAQGFNKIACSLHRNRNIVAHGGHVDMSSATLAKSISDYIALYIYTFAKYKVIK